MGNSILFSLFISKVTVLLLQNVELNEQEKEKGRKEIC